MYMTAKNKIWYHVNRKSTLKICFFPHFTSKDRTFKTISHFKVAHRSIL